MAGKITSHSLQEEDHMEQEPEYIREQREIEFIRGTIYGLANAAANTIFELALRLPPEEREDFFKTVGPQGHKRDSSLNLYNRGMRYGASELRTQIKFRIGEIPDEKAQDEILRVLRQSDEPIANLQALA